MREGSITLGIIITLGVVAVTEGVYIGVQARKAEREALEAAQAHQVEQDALQARVEALGADLGECKARVTAESLTAAATGTTDALGAALAPELADVQARAALVAAMPSQAYAAEFVKTASVHMLGAEIALGRCAALTSVKGADLAGCGNDGRVVKTWEALMAAEIDEIKARAALIEAQAACPDAN